MASEKILQQKQQYVEDLAKKLENAAGGVIVDYKGITVAEDPALRKALREAGVDNPEQYLISIAFEDPAQGMEEIYEKFVRTERIDALLAGNDTQAAILSKILRRNNLKVPNDFGLIGFDDEPFCEYMNPSISSIDDELQLQAKLIVRLMMEMIEDEESNPIDRTVTVRSRLVVRESSRKKA